MANTLNVALLFRIARLAIIDSLAKLGSVDLAVHAEQLELGFAQPVHDTGQALLLQCLVMHGVLQLSDGV